MNSINYNTLIDIIVSNVKQILIDKTNIPYIKYDIKSPVKNGTSLMYCFFINVKNLITEI